MTRKRIIGGVAAMAVALMMTAAAFAQHGGAHKGGGPGHRGGPGGHVGPGGPLLGHLARALDLTDAQQAQIKQITDSFEANTRSLHEQLGRGGGGTFEGLGDGAFDEAAVRAAAQARAAVHVELEVAHAKMMSQVFAVLTPEQRAKAAELHRQHRERRGRRQSPPPAGGEGL